MSIECRATVYRVRVCYAQANYFTMERCYKFFMVPGLGNGMMCVSLDQLFYSLVRMTDGGELEEVMHEYQSLCYFVSGY